MVDFHYDEKWDIFVVDVEDRVPEDYEESLPVGDYMIDIDDEGNFLGLELMNASQNLPFTKEELKSINNVELELNEKENTTTIGLNIEYSDNKGKVSLGYETAKA